MGDATVPSLPSVLPGLTSTNDTGRLNFDAKGNPGSAFSGSKKRGHGSRSWIRIDQDGSSEIVELDKATIMKHCSLPARDLRLLDPLFIYPSTILRREKAIVISLEQIRCIITADEVILMNSLDGCVVQYNMELCKRLQTNKDQAGIMLPLDDTDFSYIETSMCLSIKFIDELKLQDFISSS